MFWFLIGCFVGSSVGYIAAALISTSKDDN